MHTHRHVKCPLFLSYFNVHRIFLYRCSENNQTSNFIKLLPFVAELFHAGGRADRHDKANSLFQNFANAPKMR